MPGRPHHRPLTTEGTPAWRWASPAPGALTKTGSCTQCLSGPPGKLAQAEAGGGDTGCTPLAGHSLAGTAPDSVLCPRCRALLGPATGHQSVLSLLGAQARTTRASGPLHPQLQLPPPSKDAQGRGAGGPVQGLWQPQLTQAVWLGWAGTEAAGGCGFLGLTPAHGGSAGSTGWTPRAHLSLLLEAKPRGSCSELSLS